MDNEEIELKTRFKKVDELVTMRTNVIYVLIVLVGGTIGILLSIDSILKVILFIIGLFYIFVLIFNFISINQKITKLLYKKEDK